jgi:hypothetical protein
VSHLRDITVPYLALSRYAATRIPDNQRMQIIVGANQYIRFVVSILCHVRPIVTRNLHYAATIDEALRMLPQLTPLPTE